MAKINILEKGAQFINAIIERLNAAKTKPEWDRIAQEAMENQAFKIDPFLTRLHVIEKASSGMAQNMQRAQQPQRPMAQSYPNQYQPQTQYQPQSAYAGGFAPAPQRPTHKDTEMALKDLLDLARQRRTN